MSQTLIVERDVAVPMRDGIRLRADIYRPEGAGRLPVILERTPYGKSFAQTSSALVASERGYVVVIQDTRGRWSSEGQNYPFRWESSDGFDTVAWVARQSWSNGAVGMFGGSYLGYSQLAAAAEQPPALGAIAPAITFCDPYQASYTGGALNLGATLAWSLLVVAQMDLLRLLKPEAEKALLWGQFITLVDGMSKGYTFTQSPLENIPLLGRGGHSPYMLEALADSTGESEAWRSVRLDCAAIRVPAMHMGGWYDTFISHTLDNYTILHAAGHAFQKLLVGPWTHGSFDNAVGEADFGFRASGLFVLPDEIHLRWFDRWLKGERNGIDEEAPVRLFVMGEDTWRDEWEWPLARTQWRLLYLHSGGAANGLGGDGHLSFEFPAAGAPADSYVYDPSNPVSTRGGGLLGWQAALPAGAFDQRPVEARPDILIYTTLPLENDLEVTGPLSVSLWAATDAPDTDFTAKLVDVFGSGYARNVQDGIVRGRFRKPGLDSPIPTGEEIEYHIDLAATSYVFKAGHAIRLEISSSNFPRFDLNPNTGQSLSRSTEMRPAHQTIFHDAAHPSYIRLPVIPR